MKTLLERIVLLARRWATYQRVRAELETYGARELADMGISRADIARIAMEAAAIVQPQSRAKASEEPRPALLRQRYAPYL